MFRDDFVRRIIMKILWFGIGGGIIGGVLGYIFYFVLKANGINPLWSIFHAFLFVAGLSIMIENG